ncbi:hypothetical protein [Arthrobacter sp. CG_A4]
MLISSVRLGLAGSPATMRVVPGRVPGAAFRGADDMGEVLFWGVLMDRT